MWMLKFLWDLAMECDKVSAEALKFSWCCTYVVFFCIGQSEAMTGTVWNRAFLFIWNKLSEMLCRREWVQNDHQWFGKAMKLSFWRWMQKECYNLLGRQGGPFSCSDWKLGCLEAAECRQQRWAPDSWVRDGCKVGFRHRHGKIATAVCRKTVIPCCLLWLLCSPGKPCCHWEWVVSGVGWQVLPASAARHLGCSAILLEPGSPSPHFPE